MQPLKPYTENPIPDIDFNQWYEEISQMFDDSEKNICGIPAILEERGKNRTPPGSDRQENLDSLLEKSTVLNFCLEQSNRELQNTLDVFEKSISKENPEPTKNEETLQLELLDLQFQTSKNDIELNRKIEKIFELNK